jgi:replication initiation and membrane attachment protein
MENGFKEKLVEIQYYLDVPEQLRDEYTDHQYNYILCNQSCFVVLKMFFTQGSLPDIILFTFEKLSMNYGLQEEVINVLSHFLLADRRSWSKSSIEAIATDMLVKKISTFEEAVEYIREKINSKQKAAKKTSETRANHIQRVADLKREISRCENLAENGEPTQYQLGYILGLRKALQIIQS